MTISKKDELNTDLKDSVTIITKILRSAHLCSLGLNILKLQLMLLMSATKLDDLLLNETAADNSAFDKGIPTYYRSGRVCQKQS